MPELPEVETIVRELRAGLTGDMIRNYRVFWGRTWVCGNGLDPVNQRINTLSRKGKYIILNLSTAVMIVHLRMTGQLIVHAHRDIGHPHLRMLFEMNSGKILHFYDSRKFGRIYLVDHADQVLERVGADAMSPELTVASFQALIGKSRGKIKSVLLDQRRLSGLGNIYIDESLFRAGIHPETPADHLTIEQTAVLFEAIRATLDAAIRNLGTTISDYKTTGGGFGTNQNSLLVYRREDQPCMKCGKALTKIRVNNRGTHFCRHCQTLV